MLRSEREKMLARELYRPGDPEIQAELAATAQWLARYNVSLPSDRPRLLRERLGSVGEGAEIRPPFFCDYGFNIRLGAGAFVNFNCVVLDVVEVEIGQGTQIGPAVQIYAADHPRDAQQRHAGLELGRQRCHAKRSTRRHGARKSGARLGCELRPPLIASNAALCCDRFGIFASGVRHRAYF